MSREHGAGFEGVTIHGYRQMERGPDGKPVSSRCVVRVDAPYGRHSLDPRLDIREHSPAGFEWGYGGSGPAQLALALVAYAAGDEYAVPRVYQRVKRLVAGLPSEGWTLSKDEVLQAVRLACAEANFDPERERRELIEACGFDPDAPENREAP